MLQQTTVKTVIPYYRRFLKRFPSLQALAQARKEDVLTAWSGLGYYSRSRNLHRAAQICMKQHRGCLPRDFENLKALPGIGPYTAGAIASIAFDDRVPIVDGNVTRVLARLFRIKTDPKTNNGSKVFWEKAAAILPKKNYGDFNQALMELGATVCAPTQPTCTLCPIYSSCLAFASDDPRHYPQVKQKTQYSKVDLTAALIAKNGSLLMFKRPPSGVLARMWEFPMIEGSLQDLKNAYQIPLKRGRRLPHIRHSIMNRRMIITPWYFVAKEAKILAALKGSRWIPKGKIAHLPTSSLIHKLLESVPSI